MRRYMESSFNFASTRLERIVIGKAKERVPQIVARLTVKSAPHLRECSLFSGSNPLQKQKFFG
jgi:hypothetical protein